MKFIIAASIYPPDIGGPATYSQSLATELVRAGHQVKVLCFADVREVAGREAWPVIRVARDRKLWSHFHYARQLLKLASWSDLIYVQGAIAGGWQSWLMSKFVRRPYVIKVVGDYAWEQGQIRFGVKQTIEAFQSVKQRPLPVKFLAWLQSRVVRGAAAVVVPSQYLKRLVYGWGVESSKVTVIYNSFETLPVTEQQLAKERPPTIVFAGRLVPWKGLAAVIKIWGQCLAVEPAAKLEIIGDGPDRTALEKLVADNNLQSSIKFSGQLAKSALRQRLLAARGLILNSQYEGLAHAILEALAAGCLPVVTAVGGNDEVITNNVNGYLIEYNNEAQMLTVLAEILSSDEPRRRRLQAMSDSLKKFESQLIWPETIKFLTSVRDK